MDSKQFDLMMLNSITLVDEKERGVRKVEATLSTEPYIAIKQYTLLVQHCLNSIFEMNIIKFYESMITVLSIAGHIASTFPRYYLLKDSFKYKLLRYFSLVNTKEMPTATMITMTANYISWIMEIMKDIIDEYRYGNKEFLRAKFWGRLVMHKCITDRKDRSIMPYKFVMLRGKMIAVVSRPGKLIHGQWLGDEAYRFFNAKKFITYYVDDFVEDWGKQYPMDIINTPHKIDR